MQITTKWPMPSRTGQRSYRPQYYRVSGRLLRAKYYEWILRENFYEWTFYRDEWTFYSDNHSIVKCWLYHINKCNAKVLTFTLLLTFSSRLYLGIIKMKSKLIEIYHYFLVMARTIFPIIFDLNWEQLSCKTWPGIGTTLSDSTINNGSNSYELIAIKSKICYWPSVRSE